nr:hypothetical protein [Butyrivibrio sp. FCS014]
MTTYSVYVSQNPNQGIASAQYINDHNLATKVGIIYDNSDVYSSSIYQKFVEESEGKNYEVFQLRLTHRITTQISLFSFRRLRMQALTWYSFLSTTQMLH